MPLSLSPCWVCTYAAKNLSPTVGFPKRSALDISLNVSAAATKYIGRNKWRSIIKRNNIKERSTQRDFGMAFYVFGQIISSVEVIHHFSS